MSAEEWRNYVQTIINRLDQQYHDETPLPMRGAMMVQPTITERDMILDLMLLRRLYQCVLSEFDM